MPMSIHGNNGIRIHKHNIIWACQLFSEIDTAAMQGALENWCFWAGAVFYDRGVEFKMVLQITMIGRTKK